MQNFLRKMMQSAGKVVEKVGHLKSSPKTGPSASKVESPEVAQGLLSFPPENQVRKWVETLENREITPLIPNLTGKNVIQATTSSDRIWETLHQKGAELIIDLNIGHFEGSPPLQKPPHLQMIKGNFLAAPFLDQSMDYLILLGAGIRREDPTAWMKEISRILKDGSRLILSFIHPFLEYRFHPGSGFIHHFDQYFMALKKAEIYVEDIKEYRADDSLKSLIGLAKNDKNFAQLKDFPLLLIFRGIRLKRRQ